VIKVKLKLSKNTKLQLAHQGPKFIKTFIVVHAMLYDVAAQCKSTVRSLDEETAF
jgi:hypothetical protein